MSAHLGPQVAGFVDDELDPVARDRALVHLAGCDDCRAEVSEQRRVKALLAGLADPVPPAGLLDGLADRVAAAAGETPASEIPASDAAASDTAASETAASDTAAPATPAPAVLPRPRRRPATPVAAGARTPAPRTSPRGPVTGSPGVTAGASRSRRRRRWAGLAGAAVLLAVVAGSVSAGSRSQPPLVVPPVDRFAAEHADSTGGLPVTAPGLSVTPVLLPAGAGTAP
ncbi:MAG: zf-HC2 domain-containing protein [Candidatus Nanopelagicales bacterium]